MPRHQFHRRRRVESSDAFDHACECLGRLPIRRKAVKMAGRHRRILLAH
jgi:hypothetical protein